MSMWTYVRGLIELGVPGRTQAEKDYILQTVVFKELNKFLNRLAKRLNVHSVYVQLNDYGRSYTFTNKNDCYENMFDDEHPWYKYLMWEWKDYD